eukprot:CAMPEP_0198297488 /NCGR_PEP_ID=MMETSP1449-20131203/36926_1 /TAXON_ID=420275 /ORGANISM="Attheya septentrionalis, Strain CCMP2084" /LENGTH=75 /DNA_ID=CAMNT_0043998419 /DNA_START=88 /DNA_END=315 /DNA_ORIENTATION=+
MSSTAAASAAKRVLQRRAIQCSFSSVFHIRNTGASLKEAHEVETIFIRAVAIPLGIMVGVGGIAFARKKFFPPSP